MFIDIKRNKVELFKHRLLEKKKKKRTKERLAPIDFLLCVYKNRDFSLVTRRNQTDRSVTRVII